METWLLENRRRYEIFLTLTQMLMIQGFVPISTDPYAENAFRTDHTEAMIQYLQSFGDEVWLAPLKAFSAGPLFREGRSWSEAIDAEWIGIGESQATLLLLTMADDIIAWLIAQGLQSEDFTFVFGHVGWARQLFGKAGISRTRQDHLVEELRRGRLTAIHGLPEMDEDLLALFRPQPGASFFPALSQWLALQRVEIKEPCHTVWDLSLIGPKSYHTGVNFSLYHRASGVPILNGGKFEIPAQKRMVQGMGFTLSLDSVAVALKEGLHAI